MNGGYLEEGGSAPLDFIHQARLRIPCLLVATYTRRPEEGVGGGRYPYRFPAAISGGFCTHFPQEQPARLHQGQDARPALRVSGLHPKRVSWRVLTL